MPRRSSLLVTTICAGLASIAAIGLGVQPSRATAPASADTVSSSAVCKASRSASRSSQSFGSVTIIDGITCGLWNGLRPLLLAPHFGWIIPTSRRGWRPWQRQLLPLSQLEGDGRGAIVEEGNPRDI
jgi:hypothetical protein